MVPIIIQIWIWLNHSKGHFKRSERSNLAPFFTWRQFFQGLKGPKKVKFGCFVTFCQFSQKRSDNVSVYSFLGMILINCQEMDFIELFKRSLSRSERSGLAHFPIIIDIIQ